MGKMVYHRKYDLTSSHYMENPLECFQSMWATGDMVPARIPLIGDIWFATRFEPAGQLLKDSDLFSRQPERAGLKSNAQFMWWMPKILRSFGENMLMVDEPDHKRLRGIVDQAFARRGIAGLRPQIEASANRLLDVIPVTQTIDIIPSYTRALPLMVICDLLGFQGVERRKIASWAGGLTTATGAIGLILAMPGAFRMRKFLLQKFELLKENPQNGLISELVREHQSGDQLTSDELLAMVFMLFLAGHETTVHLLNGAVLALLDHPTQRAKLTADWSLLPLAIEEFLRYCSPIQITKPRFVTRDIEFHGALLRRGDKALVHIGAANWDPHKYENPTVFDISRKPNPHFSFSSGIHFCLGLQLARLEAEIALQTLFSRFPNLSLGLARNEIRWRNRIGMRALQSLPLQLLP